MMLQLFDIQGKTAIPHAVTSMIPELAAIRKNFPKEYLKVYFYIFCTTCPDGTNPYINLPEESREEVIIQDMQPFEFYMDDLSIEVARNKCRSLYETPTYRAWVGAKKMLDKIGQWLADSEITADGKDSNAMAVDRFMTKLSDYRKAYKDAESDLIEEQAKTRGNIKIPFYQQANYQEKENNLDI